MWKILEDIATVLTIAGPFIAWIFHRTRKLYRELQQYRRMVKVLWEDHGHTPWDGVERRTGERRTKTEQHSWEGAERRKVQRRAHHGEGPE